MNKIYLLRFDLVARLCRNVIVIVIVIVHENATMAIVLTIMVFVCFIETRYYEMCYFV